MNHYIEGPDVLLPFQAMEARLSDELRSLSIQCESRASELDKRADLSVKLPTEHPSSRLRYMAYGARRAYEVLL